MDDFRFVIITGMSGAGKTNFMQKLEDMGYYCVDNLPPILIARFADLCWKSTSNTRHVAVVTDIRGGSFFDALPQALKELEKGVEDGRFFPAAVSKPLDQLPMAVGKPGAADEIQGGIISGKAGGFNIKK